MRRSRQSFLLAIVLAVSCLAANRALELRGTVDPSPGRASVTLHGSEFPYHATVLSDLKGRFRFKKLSPGAYTVIIFVPGRGEVRRTVEVSESLADGRGRVTVTIPFEPSGESLKAGGTVSIRELGIPQRARTEHAKARERLGKHDVEGAREHLLRAVEIAPNYVEVWNHLGTIAYQSGEYEQAEKYFRKALEHEPGAYSPVVNLGGTLLSLRRYKEALKYNQYAAAERPDDALANSQLGQNCYFLGDYDTAFQHLKEAKRIDPSHFSYPQLFLARVYLRRGELNKAVAELEDFLARHPDSDDAGPTRRWLEKLKQF